MKTDTKQTYIMIGVALLVIAGIFIAIGLTQPKIYKESNEKTVYVSVQSGSETSAKVAENVIEIPDEPVNINTASLEELMEVEGLGKKKASAIIEYREKIGKYKSVEQILEIDGFGEETYKAVAGYLTV